jgi:hypothetical protein
MRLAVMGFVTAAAALAAYVQSGNVGTGLDKS